VSDISEPEKPKQQRDSAKLRLRRLRRLRRQPKMLVKIELRLILKIRTVLLLLPSP
jgi:hypothetical protein